MRAGKLRHLVTIQSRTEGTNSFNEPRPVWKDFATVYASIEPLSGREFFAAQQAQSDITHRVRMRYVAGVTAKHRIVFGDRVFDIAAPPRNVDERNIELELQCVEHGLKDASQ